MEPISVAVICAVAFGTVAAISAFIRQLILSRDKKLNEAAQHRALTKEAKVLESMRTQMENEKRFDSHYKLLGSNKDAIIYLDDKIEDILQKKSRLIERYSQISLKESSDIIDRGVVDERKEYCDRLKREIDSEIAFYDKELANLQERRAALWDSSSQLQNHLIEQEKSRNEKLDSVYKRQTSIIEKLFIRHSESHDMVAKETISAGTSAFKMMIMAPIRFLMQFFSPLSNVSEEQLNKEIKRRREVSQAEDDINNGFDDDFDEELTDDDLSLDEASEDEDLSMT